MGVLHTGVKFVLQLGEVQFAKTTPVDAVASPVTVAVVLFEPGTTLSEYVLVEVKETAGEARVLPLESIAVSARTFVPLVSTAKGVVSLVSCRVSCRLTIGQVVKVALGLFVLPSVA
jgi:hypothetical protein